MTVDATDESTADVLNEGNVQAVSDPVDSSTVPDAGNERAVVIKMTEDSAKTVCSCHVLKPIFTLLDLLTTEKGIPRWRGLESYAAFTQLTKAVDYFMTVNNLVKDNCKLDTRNRLLLTLAKVKVNMTFSALSELFHLAVSTTVSYFQSTLEILRKVLDQFVYWPSKETVICNLPPQFDKFRGTRVVVDCAEIPVQCCQKCLKCRFCMYSNYKGRYTIKFLIGISPHGLIIFLSHFYGGRSSDKFIFSESGLLDLCECHDGVMVDKGFHVDDICNDYAVQLIRPPFLRQTSGKFTRAEGVANTNVAKARVHVERAIQRLRNFGVMVGQVTWGLLPYMDDLLHIVSALVNLSSPIIKDTEI